MNPMLGYPPLAAAVVQKLVPRDPVLAPDERVGEVIGFYRNERELVLVKFDDGESHSYTRAELRLLVG